MFVRQSFYIVPGEDYSAPAWEVEASAEDYASFAGALS